MESLLAPLLALTGHCYVGQVAPDAMDEHCFTAMYGGQHVRDTHRVIGKSGVVYRGETIYSVEGSAIAFTYFSSIGGIGRGTAVLSPGAWHFTMSMRAIPADKPTPISIDWQWQGVTAYTVSGGPSPVTYRRTVSVPTDIVPLR
ncbi:MAG: hypothetical protein ABIU10_07280 [Sphingomicrobium sp.]